MKKLSEIPPIEPDEISLEEGKSRKDLLIERLESEGYQPIAVDRAIFVITQCDHDDDFPKGWCQDPLKLTIYGDPDLTGDEIPQELFIHGGRYGLMDVFLCIRDGQENAATRELIPVDAEIVKKQHMTSDISSVAALLSLVTQNLTGYYSEYDPKAHGAPTKHDPTLEALGQKAKDTVQEYLDHLRSLPNVWTGNWDAPLEN